MALNLLIAEDDPDIAGIVAYAMRMHWADSQIRVVNSGQAALQAFEEDPPDVVVLDINIPPPDGFEVCAQIRRVSQVPIVMLTARQATMDKIRALDLGADDYVTKPFDHMELLARLRSVVRRSAVLQEKTAAAEERNSGAPPLAAAPTANMFTTGDLSIDFDMHAVLMRGEPVVLTTTEYRLLEELARQPGEVLSHRYLLEHVWGPEYIGEDHYLKVFVRRLRNKIGDEATAPRYLQTEWGRGYRLAPGN